MKYAIFTSAGVFHCDDAPPDHPGEWWPEKHTRGVYLRHGTLGLGGFGHIQMSTVTTVIDVSERVRPDLEGVTGDPHG